MKFFTTTLLVLLVGLAGQAYAGENVQVKKAITFSTDSGAPQKVIDECHLQTQIPQFLSQFAKGSVVLVEGELSQKGRSLELEITNAFAPGGGAFSGAKSVEVSGKLMENGVEIGNFVGARYSTGGMFGGFKGTCGITARCGKSIAKDIAVWLKNPSKDARLGDSH